MLPHRVAVGVGVVTLGMGVARVCVPARAAQALGFEDRVVLVRSLGVADLLLAPALLHPRRRGPAMACRAALNGVIARLYVGQTGRPGLQRRARGGVIGMGALTLFDGAFAMLLLGREDDPVRHRADRWRPGSAVGIPALAR